MTPELLEYLAAMEARLGERIERSETALLSEFWKWAQTADARYRQAVG